MRKRTTFGALKEGDVFFLHMWGDTAIYEKINDGEGQECGWDTTELFTEDDKVTRLDGEELEFYKDRIIVHDNYLQGYKAEP